METSAPIEQRRLGPARRLAFIDFRLYWDGRVNRGHLTREFGISVPQASLDLTRYQQLAPASMIYDKRAKTYLASPEFRPSFFKPDADAYLNSLRSISDGIVSPEQTWLGRIPQFAALPVPRRSTNADHLRAILAAIEQDGPPHSVPLDDAAPSSLAVDLSTRTRLRWLPLAGALTLPHRPHLQELLSAPRAGCRRRGSW